LQFLIRRVRLFALLPRAIAGGRSIENFRGYSGRFVLRKFWPVPPKARALRCPQYATGSYRNAFLGEISLFAAPATLDRL
jgi:hypothetical protein